MTEKGLRQRVRDHICTPLCGPEESADWFCPTAQRVVMCPGPCPDGREHTPVTRQVFMHDMTDGKDS